MPTGDTQADTLAPAGGCDTEVAQGTLLFHVSSHRTQEVQHSAGGCWIQWTGLVLQAPSACGLLQTPRLGHTPTAVGARARGWSDWDQCSYGCHMEACHVVKHSHTWGCCSSTPELCAGGRLARLRRR